MTIACVGWGSLVWDPQNLPIDPPWHEDGPCLPLEFARQSQDGHLTLVIVKKGPTLPCLWVPLLANDINVAIEQLRVRERTSTRRIGFWKSANTPESIAKWASAKGFEGVVWTGLPPRFEGTDERVPTADEACSYLSALTGTARKKAEEYIRRAPVQIRTPYRDRIEKFLGWTPIA